MLKLMIDYYRYGQEALERSADLNDILSIEAREKIGRSKYVPESELADLDAVAADMKAYLGVLQSKDIF